MRWWATLLLAGLVGAEDDRFAKDVPQPLRGKINAAIDKGVEYLKSIQRPGGYWGGPEDPEGFLRWSDQSQAAGMTALCLYALGASGCGAKDPAVEKGVNFVLEKKEFFAGDLSCATYANACLVLALTRIDPALFRTPLREAADRLLRGQLPGGMWTYSLEVRRTGAPARAEDRAAWRKSGSGLYAPDNSNTQFAVLALWAAQAMAEHRAPRESWEDVRKHFLKTQEDDGGWSYRKVNSATTPTMTAAGIVSLVYATASLDGKEGAIDRARKHPAFKRALRLLPLTPLSPAQFGARRGWWFDYYLVYSIERVGTVLDLDIATWYVPGAQWLLEHQGADGGWGGGGGLVKPDPQKTKDAVQTPYETALALLFLTRATRDLVTTGGKDRTEGPVTEKGAGPDTIEGLFDLYVATRPEEREALVPKLARKEAVGLAIAKLRDKRQPVREAAFALLQRLVDRPLLFDPAGSLEERETMLGPIEAFWKEKGERLTWDEEKGRFVVP
ncbi:MAG TPA: prenyltransferase/squalene oxidase repeat-containing protein [Planctomycetota bacterium]|nr:prenyltransferase/squalene oxidase repeat-containing protein [Planctomycetota bacterium]